MFTPSDGNTPAHLSSVLRIDTNAQLTATNCTLQSLSLAAPAVHIDGQDHAEPSLTHMITNCVFDTIHTSAKEGGAVFASLRSGSTLRVDGSSFTGCTARSEDGVGGCMHVKAEEPAELYVLHTHFSPPTGSTLKGACIYIQCEKISFIDADNWEGTFDTLSTSRDLYWVSVVVDGYQQSSASLLDYIDPLPIVYSSSSQSLENQDDDSSDPNSSQSPSPPSSSSSSSSSSNTFIVVIVIVLLAVAGVSSPLLVCVCMRSKKKSTGDELNNEESELVRSLIDLDSTTNTTESISSDVSIHISTQHLSTQESVWSEEKEEGDQDEETEVNPVLQSAFSEQGNNITDEYD